MRARKTARDVALKVLSRVEEDAAFASSALDAELSRAKLSRSDSGLAHELVLGVLRWRGALDQRIRSSCHRPLDKLDPVVLRVLRLGAYQLYGPLRVPDHAAVSESVNLLRAQGRIGARASGLVNAVLRALAKRVADNPMSPNEALPYWLFSRLEQEWGRAEAEDFARISTEEPWTGLRVETNKIDRAALVARIEAETPRAVIRLGSLSPLAVRVRSLGPIPSSKSFREGCFAVQDEGAQLCTLLLDVGPGMRVLDACAGRGGKTTLLASMTMGRAELDAADKYPRKLAGLRKELERLGLGGVRAVPVDLEVGVGNLSPPYDRIFVDVPCTGTGTLARRPEIRWKLKPEDIDHLVKKQRRILSRCLSLLSPRGVLVYCSCSVLPEEGREQVRHALSRQHDDGLCLTRELSLLPHRHGTDGFYAARIAKSA